jgi:hypothetical protein
VFEPAAGFAAFHQSEVWSKQRRYFKAWGCGMAHDDQSALTTTAQRLGLFCGVWAVRRTVIDHRAGSRAQFTGQATITPELFEEHGEMRTNGAAYQSRRSYLLKCLGDMVTVQFADQRTFISIDADVLQRPTHLCGDDFYRGKLVFLSTGRWAEFWRVTGPRKHYRSAAFYRRA